MSVKKSGDLPKVAVLACGGTIAGVGEEGRSAGYTPGVLDVESVLDSCPGLDALAQISAYQVCNVNSDDMTASIWLELASRIEQLAAQDVDGFVVLHGTDTMEETAFFLDLVLKTAKPVVLTGSMRSATAVGADGPANLYAAVAVAACAQSVGRGVQVVFDGGIYPARWVNKVSTSSLSAFDGGDFGSAGSVSDGAATYFTPACVRPKLCGSFALSDMHDLPQVIVLDFHVDANPALVHAAADIASGIVLAGAGAGQMSIPFAAALEQLSIPVVVATRVQRGGVGTEPLLCANGISAGSLSPCKAAVLLRLALSQGCSAPEIDSMFASLAARQATGPLSGV